MKNDKMTTLRLPCWLICACAQSIILVTSACASLASSAPFQLAGSQQQCCSAM